MSLLPADPHAAAKRRTSLTRRVGAVTRLTTVVALTSTGGIVGALAREAHEAEALQRQPAAAPRVVIASPVARPVRTVVVRRPAVGTVPRVAAPRARPAAPRAPQSRTTTARPDRRGTAPRATQSAPATKTSGS